ncbi:MAG: translesion error-prone DNA polymerase V autoproteolytic subunit [Dehalococcoidia bacterium]|jgi:DNA polymerase V|nr:translesion error-prone DNA polymerase V autoproteolytic subunit [Dehalococcoidia bacterium]
MSMIESINYFDTGISAGFPSPAGDFISSKLNIHDYIVTNPSATFCVKVSGDSMFKAGIFSGDILVIDRSIKPLTGHIILCVLDGEYLIKKLKIINNKIHLIAANDKYNPIVINNETPFDISGVVIASIKKFI